MENEELSQEVLELVCEEAMQEYEDLRRSGLCNMFDLGCVVEAADGIGWNALLEVAENRSAYLTLLRNFGKLMKHYGITQD